MLKYITKRILLLMVTLFVIMMVSYFLLRLAPGDPSKASLFDNGSGQNLSSEKSELIQNQSLRDKLYLDKPPIIGFGYWIKGVVLEFDFGDSASVDKGRPVTDLIIEKLPVTLKLNIFALIVVYLFAIPIGIFSAITTKKKLDKVITFTLFVLYSLPAFWLALVLQATFCEGGLYPIFPLKGIVAEDKVGISTFQYLWNSVMHYALPVICLSYSGLAGLSRYAKTGMQDIISQDYIRTARAKGLSERVVIFKHAFMNSLILLITLFAGLLPGLIGGSIIIEYIFSIPGMGTLSMIALTSRDIPLLMALFSFGSILTLLGILLSDLLYVIVDPRITFDSQI